MSSAGIYEFGVSVGRGLGGDDWEGGVGAMSGLRFRSMILFCGSGKEGTS